MAISPRTATYDRLETGLPSSSSSSAGGGGGRGKPGGMLGSPRKIFAWKKFAIAAAVLIGLVYFFGPRESVSVGMEGGWMGGSNPAGVPGEGDEVLAGVEHPVKQPSTNPPPPPPSNNPASSHGGAATIPPPTSFETDANPAGTVFCTAPYKPHLPIVQYAMMIDAGSQGSRIHIYKFNNCKSSPSYEYETFRQTRPGLSHYASPTSPDEAAKSLDVLMKEAMRVVPGDLRKCTPVAVKATAGLRLLGEEGSEGILRAVRRRLEGVYPFKVVEGREGVEIMDGKDEGVYAWITANYLLETIHAGAGGEKHLDDGPGKGGEDTTYAVLDLGGASTQIVFEPKWETGAGAGSGAGGGEGEGMWDGEHKYDLSFGAKKHVLYQHSYLGYGLMKARQHVHSLVDFMASIRASPSKSTSSKGSTTGGEGDEGLEVIGNPCLARGTKRRVEVEDERSGTKRNVTMSGSDIGSYEACNRVVQLVMAKDSICEVKPCSFNGVYQPSLLDTFPSGKVLLLSYFYDRISPLIPGSSPSSPHSSTSTTHPNPKLTVSTFSSLAQTVCQGHSAWVQRWGHDNDVMKELSGRPEWCLDLTFMHGLLRLGYEFDDEREVVIEKEIAGTELGWALGATISMVSGGRLSCRA